MGEHVVGDDERARLDLVASELEELLVVLLLGVEEDEVEDVVDLRQRLRTRRLRASSTVSSSPASATLRRQASTLAGSDSRESTRPPK